MGDTKESFSRGNENEERGKNPDHPYLKMKEWRRTLLRLSEQLEI